MKDYVIWKDGEREKEWEVEAIDGAMALITLGSASQRPTEMDTMDRTIRFKVKLKEQKDSDAATIDATAYRSHYIRFCDPGSVLLAEEVDGWGHIEPVPIDPPERDKSLRLIDGLTPAMKAMVEDVVGHFVDGTFKDADPAQMGAMIEKILDAMEFDLADGAVDYIRRFTKSGLVAVQNGFEEGKADVRISLQQPSKEWLLEYGVRQGYAAGYNLGASLLSEELKDEQFAEIVKAKAAFLIAELGVIRNMLKE